MCYLHLLHGGGAVGDIPSNATAFGCRDWDFACVITGVWPRDQDTTRVARDAVQWVYNVATNLLPSSSGAYGADLGPNPRDAALAAKAFGGNLARLARLKHTFDPSDVLAYACPLPKAPTTPKLIVVVTGKHSAGKDYCAPLWKTTCIHNGLRARVVSISDATKREYAVATGADLERFIHDRAYKEQHRPELTAYFDEQVRRRAQLPEENFVNVVHSAGDVDVLFVTGMRDEAPLAAFSHLVPDNRLLEVRVEASSETRRPRRGFQSDDAGADEDKETGRDSISRPEFIFHNDANGDESAKLFCEERLLNFFHEDLNRLADMVHLVRGFPDPGIVFRDVLGISERPGNIPTLAPICEAGKLPPPTISVVKSASHISSSTSRHSAEKKLEMGREAISKGSSMLVVDDVLASGKTLLAVLQLLDKAANGAEEINVLVVAEFPEHRGRELLRQHGYGRISIQSLLVFGGA